MNFDFECLLHHWWHLFKDLNGGDGRDEREIEIKPSKINPSTKLKRKLWWFLVSSVLVGCWLPLVLLAPLTLTELATRLQRNIKLVHFPLPPTSCCLYQHIKSAFPKQIKNFLWVGFIILDNEEETETLKPKLFLKWPPWITNQNAPRWNSLFKNNKRVC